MMQQETTILMLNLAIKYEEYIKNEFYKSENKEYVKSIDDEIGALSKPLNLEDDLELGYINILAAKINSVIDLKDILPIITNNKISKAFVDTRWIRNLHKLRIMIDVVKANIPENLEQSSSAPSNIDMKKLLLNSIDNLSIFCNTYIDGSIVDCLKISMQDITTTTQSADMALQLISSVDEKKIISLVSNMYLTYRETLDLIPEEIVVNEAPTTEAMKNPLEGAISDTPIKTSAPANNIPGGLGGLLGGMMGGAMGAMPNMPQVLPPTPAEPVEAEHIDVEDAEVVEPEETKE